jgi:hypothetical protein
METIYLHVVHSLSIDFLEAIGKTGTNFQDFMTIFTSVHRNLI